MLKKRVGWVLGLFCAMAMTGCASNPLMVNIVAPAGSTMEVGEKKYTLPSNVPFNRPDKPGEVYRTNVAFTFPIKGQAIPAEGVLLTYGFVETDVDRLSTNTCNVSEAELTKLMEGYAVIFDGFSASDHKLIYKITIGKKK